MARKPARLQAGEAPDNSQTFRLRTERNLVQVRVVILDSHGKAVRGLTKDEFLLFDNGKRQEITGFSAQSEGAPAQTQAPAAPAPAAKPSLNAPPAPNAIPNQFVALYYDDLWMSFSDMTFTRKAAEHYLQTEVKPDDRVGIFTSSGQGNVDFTSDRQKLDQALAKLHPRSMEGPAGSECPPLTDYEAYLVNQEAVPIGPTPGPSGPGRSGGNEFAVTSVMPSMTSPLGIATQQVIECECGGDASHCPDPAVRAKEAARVRWATAQYQIRNSLGTLDQLVQRMALLPGRRTILFISPGFVDMDDLPQLSAIIDRAVREGIVINGLDSRGLWARTPGGDASDNSKILPVAYEAQLEQLQRRADQADSDVMVALAEGTGGIFFHNNNDLDQGFREAGGLPQFAYVLAFSPSNLKDNGAYHQLKVKLTEPVGHGLTVEARKGYYAPKKSTDADVQTAEEIKDTVFSRSELHGLSLHVEAGSVKTRQGKTALGVIVHLGAQGLDFKRAGDQYTARFTSVTGIFDDNGNYLQGTEKTVDMSLTKAQLKQVQKEGLRVGLQFDVPPGSYLVRNVIRDSSGAMAAVNSTVRISF